MVNVAPALLPEIRNGVGTCKHPAHRASDEAGFCLAAARQIEFPSVERRDDRQ
jgi:hypothetical protein